MKRLRPCLSARTLVLAFLLALPTASLAQGPTYVGAKKCKACHLKQFNSWSQTRMANAFDILKPKVAADRKIKAKLDPNKDYTHDPKCLECHTTGYGKPGGFKSIETTPDLAGVQCESCHGPHSEVLKIMTIKNKEYKRTDVVKAGLVVPSEKTCKDQCHNPKSPLVPPGYTFDYEANKKKGTHEHIPLKYKHD